MKQLRNELKRVCEENTKNKSEKIDINSTVVDKAQIHGTGPNDLITINLYLNKSNAEDQRKDSVSYNNTITITDLFGHGNLYKFSFVMLEQLTEYDKEEISEILHNDTVVSKKYHLEDDFVMISIPIIRDYVKYLGDKP